jgi:L-aminopeptidase/D-esterase-like protein
MTGSLPKREGAGHGESPTRLAYHAQVHRAFQRPTWHHNSSTHIVHPPRSALMNSAPNLTLTAVPGLEVGHDTDTRRPTGCTVVLCREGATAGVDVRGAAPGTRETDLLAPENTVSQVHGLVLSGGSAFGLDSAGGVMRWLEEHGHGFPVGPVRVPIVPGAVIFDLLVGDGRVRPDASSGYRACERASSAPVEQGCVGAGAGATVGKLWGPTRAMKGGLGSAALQVGPWVVGALVVCNAIGDVVDPQTGQPIAGARIAPDRLKLVDTVRTQLSGTVGTHALAGSNTTIGVVGCNARLSKAQAKRLAQVGHDGWARTIRPVHTPMDGDTLFTLATARVSEEPDMLLLSTLAAEVVAQATVQAVRQATSLRLADAWWPCAGDRG